MPLVNLGGRDVTIPSVVIVGGQVRARARVVRGSAAVVPPTTHRSCRVQPRLKP